MIGNLAYIRKLQKDWDLSDIQKKIEDGSIWKFEGSIGRHAMNLLKMGACFLGQKPTYDYYGNRIPSRYEVKSGTTGSIQLTKEFWTRVDDGLVSPSDIC